MVGGTLLVGDAAHQRHLPAGGEAELAQQPQPGRGGVEDVVDGEPGLVPRAHPALLLVHAAQPQRVGERARAQHHLAGTWHRVSVAESDV